MPTPDDATPLMDIARLLETEQLALPDHADMLLQMVPRGTNSPLKGEGRPVKGFETPMQVVGWRWGVARRSNLAEAGSDSRSAAARMVSEFTVMKIIDQASPVIAKLCCENELLQHATLKCFKAGGQAEGSQIEYMSFELRDAIVRNYQVYTSARFNRPFEIFQLAFRQLAYSYVAQTERGGAGATTRYVIDAPGGDR